MEVTATTWTETLTANFDSWAEQVLRFQRTFLGDEWALIQLGVIALAYSLALVLSGCSHPSVKPRSGASKSSRN